MIRLFEFLLPSNIGVSFETVVLLVFNIGLFVFAAKDFRLASVIGFVLNSAVFAWFYTNEWYYVPPMILMFLFLILMVFSIFGIHSNDVRVVS